MPVFAIAAIDTQHSVSVIQKKSFATETSVILDDRIHGRRWWPLKAKANQTKQANKKIKSETMSDCSMCQKKLTFMNTPNFGGGKLMGGGRICRECFIKVSSFDVNLANNSKKHTLDEILKALQPTYHIRNKINALRLPHQATFFSLTEIDQLPEILAAGEELDNLIQGYYNNGTGLLVSTTRRLIFLDKGTVYGLKVEDFPLDKISSIQYETGLVLAKVTIHTSGNTAKIENVENKAARAFSEFVRDKLSRPVSAQAVPPPLSNLQQPNIMEQLQRLGDLKATGVLSDEEFASMKSKLIERM